MERKSFKNISNVRIFPAAKIAAESEIKRRILSGLPPASMQDIVNQTILAALGGSAKEFPLTREQGSQE